VEVSAHLRDTFAARFPGVDFTPYFAFIESRPDITEVGDRHHILPRKEFPEHVKNPNNRIRLSLKDHYWLALCAPDFRPFQMVFFFMTQFKKYASQLDPNELPRYAEVYERGLKVQRKQASELGRSNVTSGRLAKLRTPEHQAKAGRAGGKLGGKTQGPITGRWCVNSGFLESIASAGGRATVESGQLALARAGVKREDRVKWGKVSGPKASHTRWHVNRGITSSKCSLCEKGSL